MEINKVSQNDPSGIMYGTLAFSVWGILPLYWRLLRLVPALEILAHRILWSFVFIWVVILLSGAWRTIVSVLSNKRNVLLILLSSILISLNWYTYIWAVNSNHIIEASMGYYINPLVAVLLGMTILKEKMNRWQWVAIALATIGVLIMTAQFGRVPWVSLILAGSFGLYGLLKKLILVDSATGLAIETIIVMPIALVYIIYLEIQGVGALGSLPFGSMLILIGSGVATSIPLLWFAKGAQKIKLSVMGFLQYISPTLTLILGIFVFKEPFTSSRLISFGFIWAAVLVFTLTNVGILKLPQPTRLHEH